MAPNIANAIRHHVSLEVRCIDRFYVHDRDRGLASLVSG